MSDAQAEATILPDSQSKTMLGFWIYLMTDCILFASLFATYAVLHNNTFGGPSGGTIFSLSYVMVETLALLSSSFTCGIAVLFAQRHAKKQALFWFALTFILGFVFLVMELTEFRHLVADGNSWRRSGFLSSYFTLVGTHGLHITVGLLWMAISMVQMMKRGLSEGVIRRITLFGMFWHFLDIVWIFIFTIVYMLGAL